MLNCRIKNNNKKKILAKIKPVVKRYHHDGERRVMPNHHNRK